MILAFVFLMGTASFPNIVRSTTPENNITIFSAASSYKTLTIGLLIAAIGMPCVMVYTMLMYCGHSAGRPNSARIRESVWKDKHLTKDKSNFPAVFRDSRSR